MATTTFVYDDPDRPDRPTGTIASPAYVPEDQALLMAFDIYEAGLCNCGYPREQAWHSDMDGWYEGEAYVCHACTARNGGEQVVKKVAHSTRPADLPLPAFVLGETTTTP